MTDPGTYLDMLSQRLAGYGFSVWRSVPMGPQTLDLLAAGRRVELSKFGEMARVITVARVDPASPDSVAAYSATVAKHALEGGFASLPRGLGGSVLCVPAVVADAFDETTKGWVTTHLAPKHFAAFEFPALVSLAEGRVLYCRKTPIWGAAYYRGFRKFVDEALRP